MAGIVRSSVDKRPNETEEIDMGTLIKRIVGGIIIAKLVGKFTGRNRGNQPQ